MRLTGSNILEPSMFFDRIAISEIIIKSLYFCFPKFKSFFYENLIFQGAQMILMYCPQHMRSGSCKSPYGTFSSISQRFFQNRVGFFAQPGYMYRQSVFLRVLTPPGAQEKTRGQSSKNSCQKVTKRAETSPKITISKNREIVYNCIYIVNFRKLKNPKILSFRKFTM